MLVETFRKRNGELRKERPPCPASAFTVWELLLQQVEIESQIEGDIARHLNDTVGTKLIERVFHKKIASRKVFVHRDRIETIIDKANELLAKNYQDYVDAFERALTDPAQYMSEYIAAHNVYVHQMRATNGMIQAYQTRALPKLLEELEECQLEVNQCITSSVQEASDFFALKSKERTSGHQMIVGACKQVNHKSELAMLVKHVHATAANNNNNNNNNNPQQQQPSLQLHHFKPPTTAPEVALNSAVPILGDELALEDTGERTIVPPADLEAEREKLEKKLEKLDDSCESLCKMQQRSLDSKLHNKVNEIQEELSLKKFDSYVAHIHLAAVRAQLSLFHTRPLYLPIYHNNSANNSNNGNNQANQQQQQQLAYGYHPSDSVGCDSDSANITLTNGIGGGANISCASANTGSGATDEHTTSANSKASGFGSPSMAANNSSGIGTGSTTVSSSSSLMLAAAAAAAASSSSSYKSRWIKAFKSLKDTKPSSSLSSASASQRAENEERARARDSQRINNFTPQENQHFFQEYTFKKIAACDVCREFLRGHLRQGMKCKLCKISCHVDCQAKAHTTIKCQLKMKLLRRQKSASELEVGSSDVDDAGNERVPPKPDGIYQIIRQALEAKRNNAANNASNNANSVRESDGSSSGYLMPGMGGASGQQLGCGNLALANKNGKSVSTGALGPTGLTATSVDRWAVVMSLLAQSRQDGTKSRSRSNNSNNADANGQAGATGSKQLERFRTMAKAAAHSQHVMQQESQRQQQQPQQTHFIASSNQSNNNDSATSDAQQRQQYHHAPPTQLHLQQTQSLPLGGAPLVEPPWSMAGAGGGPAHGLARPAHSAHPSLMGAPPQQQQQQQQQHRAPPVPHARTTQQAPVVSVPQQVPVSATQAPVSVSVSGPSQVMQPAGVVSSAHPHVQLMNSVHLPLAPSGGHNHAGIPSSPSMGAMPTSVLSDTVPPHRLLPDRGHDSGMPRSLTSNAPNHQQQAPNKHNDTPYMLAVQQTQSHTTSAPHSPQRQKFSLRMKSFSLDSPEAPGHEPHGLPEQLIGSDTRLQHHNGPTNQQQHQHLQQQQLHQSQQQHGSIHHTMSYNRAIDLNAAGHDTTSYGGPIRRSMHVPSSGGGTAGVVVPPGGPQSVQTQSPPTPTSPTRSGQANYNPALVHHTHHTQQMSPLSADYYDLNLDIGRHHQTSGRAMLDFVSADQHSSDSSTVVDPLSSITSPCLSPVAPKTHRMLPTNLYVVLYDFRSRRADELDLKAGQLTTVIDTSDRDWWKGRSLDGSRTGFFPSTYVTKLYPNERPVRVVQTIQVSNGETCEKLLRDQIVIFTGEHDADDVITVRSGIGEAPNRFIKCPQKYLQEVDIN
ncbi:SH3 and cysteine-rich domain-containing protein [Fragariocoptes setiger]|uniref:SH3 and cysteine-rich domain-containing protein n=1 Tax=Fragariocoptes setiger TaxID=1670756 RepID=A0ABQ7SBX7_9ACAR|nr:SH3 and cysteine-rich domain-containing protein [Fragariocoptes setiger]